MKRLKWLVISIFSLILSAGGVIYVSHRMTNQEIIEHRLQVIKTASLFPVSTFLDKKAISDLPQPVQKYFQFVFKQIPNTFTHLKITMSGQFRRPLKTEFYPTTASQTIAVGTPALMFDAQTFMIPGIWAIAYDAFAEGKMRMKAKVLSTITVMNESETPELNKTSLRRWLLESPLYPMALLPGGPVRWQTIDENKAKATVSAFGASASLIATFRADGSLERFDAEEDGDLTTPYHGSGEHVLRTKYREVQGMMIPMGFEIARSSNGQLYPFWKGLISSIEFMNTQNKVATHLD